MTHIWQGLRSGAWLTAARAGGYSLIVLGLCTIAMAGWIAVSDGLIDGNGKPIPLGSSFVEFNAGVNPGQASCITCHKYAYFDGKDPGQGNAEDNFGGAPTGWPSVGYACNNNQNGNCTPFVPNSTSQDFSWILGLMPFN